MPEPLSERIRRLQAEVDANTARTQQKIYQSAPARAARDFAGLAWFFTGLLAGLKWAWTHVVWPVWRQLRRPIWWLLKRYVDLWNRVTMVADPYGKLVFSKMRAGLMVIATLVFCFYFLGPILSLAADGAVYLATARYDEEIILFGSQQIDSKDNLHIAEGCYNYPCKDGESLYFRIKNSLFNNLWKITHTGGLFYPDLVAAAVPTGYSRCVVTTYGVRWRVFVMNTEMFPELLDIQSCKGIAPTGESPPAK